MSNKQGGMQRFFIFMAGKGFYLVLFLCVVAIGVSGYMLFFRDTGGDDFTISYVSPSPGLNTPSPQPTLPAARVTERPALPTLAPTPDMPVLGPADIPPHEDEPAAGVTNPPEPGDTDGPEEPAGLSGFFWPVNGALSENEFTGSMLVFNEAMQDWRVHPGIDIETGLGNLVMASGDGIVTDVGDDILFGMMVTIEHPDGYVTRYGNLQKAVSVTAGQLVQAGDIIGGVGDTASGGQGRDPYLHFELLKDGEQVNPLDYLPVR